MNKINLTFEYGEIGGKQKGFMLVINNKPYWKGYPESKFTKESALRSAKIRIKEMQTTYGKNNVTFTDKTNKPQISFFSLGQNHEHRTISNEFLTPDVLIVIIDENPRDKMFELFKDKWSMQYELNEVNFSYWNAIYEPINDLWFPVRKPKITNCWSGLREKH